MKSQQAQVAAIIKKAIVSMGYECTVRSDSFSGGTSVDVEVNNLPPNVFKKIKDDHAQYQYGHFNGMEDIYEYSNSRDDIPQTKYLHIANRYSQELKQAAWAVIREQFGFSHDDSETRPELLSDAQCCRICGVWAPDLVYRMLSAQFDENWSIGEEFWNEHGANPKGKKAPVSVSRPNTGAEIQEHTHTKKGFQMFIVVLAEKVERSAFNDLLQAAKGLGGWYSRQWGTTPGGFAFKEQNAAQEFIASHC